MTLSLTAAHDRLVDASEQLAAATDRYDERPTRESRHALDRAETSYILARRAFKALGGQWV